MTGKPLADRRINNHRLRRDLGVGTVDTTLRSSI